MDIKIQETNPTRRSVTVTVPAATVAAAEKEVVKGFSREAALPGFRPGKAPEAVVRLKYGKQIADEVSQRLLSQGYERIQQEKSFTIYTVADVQKEAGTGADAVFRYEVDVVPDFKTPDWKSVKVPVETVTVTDADIDQHLQKILEQRARYEKTEDAAAKGDYVRIGYVGTVDGKPVSEVDAEAKSYGSAESTWEEVPGQSIPTIDIEGNAEIADYQESFLPFRIRDVDHGNFLPGDVHEEFQTDYVESVTGELTIYRTRLIALDKGPMNSEWGFYISTNPRLISLEGIRNYDQIELEENGLDESTLKKSIDLTPGTTESIEYYQSLLQLPEFSSFDEEQIQFIFERIGHSSGIQNYIDENPEKMAVLLNPVWKKIKSMDQFKGLQFPENISREVDMMSDLHDIGL
jgi:hypothetical protein